MVNGNGEIIKRNFEQKYTVVDPSATVSADLMNVLYAGYSNPLSVSVPGVPLNKVQATMTGGTLQPVGPGRYIARPTAVGQNVTITVTSTNTGRPQQMGQFTFRVRRLASVLLSTTASSTLPSRYSRSKRCSSTTWVMPYRWFLRAPISLLVRRRPSVSCSATVVSTSHVSMLSVPTVFLVS